MAERIYPSAKPIPHPPSAANGAAPVFPAPKAQAYGRPAYRPQPPPKRRRSRRSCWCSCCLWITLVILALIFLAAIAGGVFYVLYRPHRPTFTVTSLRLSQFNLTSSDSLTSRLDLSVTARNPNKKISFLYDPVAIAVSSNGVGIGQGSFPAFVHGAGNTTLLKTTVSSSGESLDSTAASDLKKKSSIPLEIDLDTRAGVKIGSIKTKKIGIKVSCDGFDVTLPKKKAGAPAKTADVSCKVKLRIKIWKWTF